MAYKTITDNIKENIAYITLNRPERLNSFDLQLEKDLYQVLKKLKNKPDIRAVIIKGTGKRFCGGGDVKEMYVADNKPRFLREFTRAIYRCVIEMRTMKKPVIAAVNGAAFGAGLSLAIACDIIVAVKEAKLGTAFIGIGLAQDVAHSFLQNSLDIKEHVNIYSPQKHLRQRRQENWE